jgi:hypothetical protein
MGERLGAVLEIPWIDSDDYFHKPTDPPYQAQYSKDERRDLIHREFDRSDSWVLSGSISAWDIHDVEFTHAVLIDIGVELRLKRLKVRERERFGHQIDPGGDMHNEHTEFMKWAASYESGEQPGRNLPLEKTFMAEHCIHVLSIEAQQSVDELEKMIISFTGANLRGFNH